MSDVELSEANSSDAGSSGAVPLDEDGGSYLSEGPNHPFILPDDWEVNKYCSSLPAAKLDKI